MKILITGAPGWMGTRLARRLIDGGHEVRCLIMPGISAGSLAALGAQTVEGDLTNRTSLAGVCSGIELVYHCAGIIHPRRAREFYAVNTGGTRNLLQESAGAGVRRFVYVSSNAAAHGFHSQCIVNEDAAPRPFMDYGRSKLLAEEAVHQWGREGRLEGVVIRPNWLYGMDGPPRQVGFLRMVQAGNAIRFGSAANRHSLCDLDNCIAALCLAGVSQRAVGRTYYVADAGPYGLDEIYRRLGPRLGSDAAPREIGSWVHSPPLYSICDRLMQGVRFWRPELHIAWEWSKSLVCSIERCVQELGYKPERDFFSSMEEEIERLIGSGALPSPGGG